MQLEVVDFTAAQYADLHFNSILVQLEVKSKEEANKRKLNFNSILVQLEEDGRMTALRHFRRFQFHIGAIRSVPL